MYIPVPGLPYRRPNEDDIARLLKELGRINVKTRLRKSSQIQMQGRVIYSGKLAMFNFKTSNTVHLVHPTIPEDMLAPHT